MVPETTYYSLLTTNRSGANLVGDKSAIEWTDATWNPVRGCAMVSAGCTNCYAMKQAHRQSGENRVSGPNAFVRARSDLDR